ncbi:MAG: PH domain-containing protein [Candidatus Bathyarchaeota archaeon]|nr:PH domain-containing protein [Candidatus Bathyarchaeota archaeon]
MSVEIPPQLFDNLAKGEEVKRTLKTRSLLNIPEFTFLTDRRVIYYNQKILGRFDLIDIPYSRLSGMKAERGMIAYGTMSFTSEDGDEISLKRIPKDEIENFVMALEVAINNVAVEAIRIKRKKGLAGKMIWEFNKSAEMIFKSRPPESNALSYQSQGQQNQNADPLNELKLRLARGEITVEEYLEMEKIFKA